jgi:hypothetical protein
MNNRTKETIIALARPIYVVVRPFAWLVHKTLFEWLEVWSQRTADSCLLLDIRANLPFLFPAAEIVKERWYRILPFDYASVRLNFKNICFYFSRGRGELNVALSPVHKPQSTSDLRLVIAVLESVNISKINPVNGFGDVAGWISSRLNALNDAFSVDTATSRRDFD